MTADAGWLKEAVIHWKGFAVSSEIPDQKKLKELLQNFEKEAGKLEDIFRKFKKIIQQMSESFAVGERKWSEIEDKCKGAVDFFTTIPWKISSSL